jgi:RNA polymerase sigma-70 factor (ECF subfamily)
VTSASVLASLLATLKGPQALAIRLVKLDGLSIEEAAAATGQSPSLVKVNIHRGLARLTARLAAAPEADADADA